MLSSMHTSYTRREGNMTSSEKIPCESTLEHSSRGKQVGIPAGLAHHRTRCSQGAACLPPAQSPPHLLWFVPVGPLWPRPRLDLLLPACVPHHSCVNETVGTSGDCVK